LSPEIPVDAFSLNPFDNEWDDEMNFPRVNHTRFAY